jgi:hypothetical protein
LHYGPGVNLRLLSPLERTPVPAEQKATDPTVGLGVYEKVKTSCPRLDSNLYSCRPSPSHYRLPYGEAHFVTLEAARDIKRKWSLVIINGTRETSMSNKLTSHDSIVCLFDGRLNT